MTLKMSVFLNIKICPFVEKPFDECYCVKLTSWNIESAIYYCGEHFEQCSLYKKICPYY